MKIKKILSVIGLIFFFYILYDVGVLKILSTIKNSNLYYLAFAVILTPAFILPLAFKWWLILKKQGFNLNFSYVLKLYYIGAFYGFITPAHIGSLIRAHYLKNKTKKGLIECASGIIIERIFDLFTIFIFAFIGALFLLKSSVGIISPIIVSFIVFLIAILIFMRKKRGMLFLSVFYNLLLPKNIKEKADNSLDKFYNSLPKLRKLISIFLITIISWIIFYSQTYIFAKAFYINIPFPIFVSLVSIGTIIATIPISISGLGTREFTLITLFSLFNISPESVVSMSLVSFVTTGLIEGALGLYFAFKEDEIFNYNTVSS